MKAIKLKTATAPKVYFSEGAVKNWNTNKHALVLASKVIGLVVLKVTNNTGFTDEQMDCRSLRQIRGVSDGSNNG